MDIRLSQISSYLRLEYESWDDFEESEFDAEAPPSFYIPDSGAQFLGNLRKCSAQIAHTDFAITKDIVYPDVDGYLSYFIIATGKDEAPILVLPNSHKYVYNVSPGEKAYASHSLLQLKTIPPYSVFIGRSDLIHAGAGSKEMKEKYACAITYTSSAKEWLLPMQFILRKFSEQLRRQQLQNLNEID